MELLRWLMFKYGVVELLVGSIMYWLGNFYKCKLECNLCLGGVFIVNII